MLNRTRATMVLVLGFAACLSSCKQPQDSPFAGVWVMNVDGRTFMVLTLEPDNGRYGGTLTRPRRMTSDGRNFSGISQETTTARVTTEPPRGSALRIVATDPEAREDTEAFELSLTAADQAQLKIVEAPIEPWPFTRHSGTGTPRVFTGWDAKRSYPLQDPYADPNPEMAAIYAADQALRKSAESFRANETRIGQEDVVRRERTRALLAKNALRSAEDFRLAAMVFQHGNEPRDYLFAHTLALVALSRGDRSASWIAAASLDRYLQSIAQPQIYGAAFGPDGQSQGAFDRELVSDALRHDLGVPALSEQQAQMQRLIGQGVKDR